MAPKIVICSSFRFYQEVVRLQRYLQEAGYPCEIPVPNEFLDPSDPTQLRPGIHDYPEVFEAHWRNLGHHLKRIEGSDIVVIHGGEEGYVGQGVSSEMGFAHGARTLRPSQLPSAVISTAEIPDMAMQGYVDEVVLPEELPRRLSSETW